MAETLVKTEFIEEIKNSLEDLGEIRIEDVSKSGYNYTGLMIKVIGKPMPVLNLDKLYARYCNGGTIEECKDTAREILTKNKCELPVSVEQLQDWEFVKDKLYLRLAPFVSEGVLSRPWLDLFLVPYINIDSTYTCAVVEGLRDTWGVDEETVFEQAKTSQENIRPLKIVNLGELMGGPSEGFPVYVVGVEDGVCGATAITYDGTVDTIKAMIGEFYILPSSINDMIVIGKDFVGKDILKLKAMIAACNVEAVPEEEIIGNSIYTYDFEKREFVKVM